jgi:hypothetical protein
VNPRFDCILPLPPVGHSLAPLMSVRERTVTRMGRISSAYHPFLPTRTILIPPGLLAQTAAGGQSGRSAPRLAKVMPPALGAAILATRAPLVAETQRGPRAIAALVLSHTCEIVRGDYVRLGSDG